MCIRDRFCTLLELNADTVALVGDAGFSGVDSYAPVILSIVFLLSLIHI